MVSSLLSAQAWRSKYWTQAAYQRAFSTKRTAVVVGATSGIGEACSHRLAEQGFCVVAVGRDRPGRAEQVVQALQEKSSNAMAELKVQGDIPQHEFFACDAFSLKNVYETGQRIQERHPKIDALVLSQGMATTQGFTPTAEGNDEKMTLHYYSRMCFIQSLLPALQKSDMPAVVVSVLSGGVHSPYKDYKTHPGLKSNYSMANAANAAGYYNDLGLDQMALKYTPLKFVHACPGFVNTNWGSEFHPILRGMVRLLQPFGRKPADCADYLMGSTVLAADAGDFPPSSGVAIVGQNGEKLDVTAEHTEDARTHVWKHSVEVLKEAGVPIEE
ncbi:short chain dehydrogenase [Seminavis robusta]|uniref:Short chain dehydrogenase n=1 Tax=Seminavis robusta TaxID=568900 RepID=A0A9N8EFN9_9STRA|nr:short chain dehydrogenase [Seminavis robusta]|eukprot:Sro1125_g244000.1 short chain dehydrogenase (329) ;mRNA; r:34042-35028